MMKQIVFALLLCTAFSLTACFNGSYEHQLAEVDSLLSQVRRDSAYTLFTQISRDDLGRTADRMYYDVLQSELSQVSIAHGSFNFDAPRDSVLRRCIDYYEKKDNPRMLLYSCLYMGKVLLESLSMHQEASTYLKRAEELLSFVNDTRLAYQTYEAITTLNYYSGNYDMAMDYSYKTLACAHQSGNNHMMTYACNHLVVLYLQQQEKDSVTKYIRQSMKLLNQMPPRDRSYALGNLAVTMLANDNIDSAEVYFNQAKNEFPHRFINQRLAEISYIRGHRERAESLWNDALQAKDLRDQVEVYQSIMERKHAGGEYQAAADAALTLLELKDSLVKQKQTAEVKAIQLKYDKEVEQRKLYRVTTWTLMLSILLISIIAAITFYHIHKSNKAKQTIMQAQLLISDYLRQIEQLQQSGKDATKDIVALKKKINVLQEKQTEILSEGHQLFEKIARGGTAATWTKENFQKFIEYYKVVNLPFMLRIESEYTNLSHGNRFFLILQDMGKTDEEMTHILGVSDGALRTARSRLRKKQNK